MMTFTKEETDLHVEGLRQSKELVDSVISSNVKGFEEIGMMDRNVRHIAIMCSMPNVKESGIDLKPFMDAAAAGTAWMAA